MKCKDCIHEYYNSHDKVCFVVGRKQGRTYAQQMLIVANAVLKAAKNRQTVAKIEITVIEKEPREPQYTLTTEDF